MKNTIFFLSFLFSTITLLGQEYSPQKKIPIFVLSEQDTIWEAAKSGNLAAQLATQSDNIQQINFNPALVFKSEKTIKSLPVNIDGYPKLTIFTVYQPSTNKEMFIWGNTTNGRKASLTTHQMVGPAGVNAYTIEVPDIPLISTVTHLGGSNSRGSKEAHLQLGGLKSEEQPIAPFEGYIAELLVFDKSFAKEEKEQIESFLALKYGVTLKNTHYRNTNNDILWNSRTNKEYAHRITGIGRDDVSQLQQNKSKSTAKESFIQLGISPLDTFENHQFMIWGDNGRPFALKDNRLYQGKYKVLDRQWVINVVNNNGLRTKTDLKINTKSLNLDGDMQAYLVISKTGELNLSSKELRYLPFSADKGDGNIYFDDIVWDLDQSGSDYFTFAFAPKTMDAKSLSIYPNPAKKKVTIDIALKEIADLQLAIHDANGRTVFQTKETGKRFYQLQKEFTKEGVYLVSIKTKFGKLTKEFIILE